MMLSLSKRLEAVAVLIPNGAFLADVGSDHAYLPIALMERGAIRGAIAIDNKKAPYERMRQNVKKAGLEGKISCSLSDGIESIGSEVDTIALCGIGGLLTLRILSTNPDKLAHVDAIVLDPHADQVLVRKRLSEMGFHLDEECMVEDQGIYYSLMRWRHGAPQTPYTGLELKFGPILLKKKSKDFLAYLSHMKKEDEKILAEAKNLPSKNHDSLEKEICFIDSYISDI